MCEDIYAALPELRPLVATKEGQRSKRGLGALLLSVVPGLITLAVESLSSYIKGKQLSRIDNAVVSMRENQQMTQNKLQQYSEDFLMYGKYNVETLSQVIDTVNSLHRKQTQFEKAFTKMQFGQVADVMDAMTFNFDLQLYLKLSEEEHGNQYEHLMGASKDLLKGIATLSQGKLPQELFPDRRLKQILRQVEVMVKKQHPDYELAADHISHYRDMKLVTFAVDQETHSLIVAFPVFIKDFRRPPLSMFEIETVPIPIPDKNKNADSYSQVHIHKPYIAVGTDYYIQLRMTELVMCKSIRYTYYCEELFVVKHKSKHSCASAIFYDLGPKVISKNCKFDYTFHKSVPPVILDGGKDLLLANFHGPRSLKCNSQNGGLARPIPEHTYAVVPRDFLCDCQLDLEHASVLRQLSACSNNSTDTLHIDFVVNIAFYEILRQHNPRLVSNIKPKVRNKPQSFEIRLSEDKKAPLDHPTHLKEIISKFGDEGKLVSSGSQQKDKAKPLLNKVQTSILLVTCTFLAISVFVALVFLAVKHCKLRALVAGLALSSAAPMTEAKNLGPNSKESAHLPNRVICTDPILTGLATAASIAALLTFVYMQCAGLTWLYGYKYDRYCTLYMFIYNDNRYVPLKIKHLKGHLHMYRLENSVDPESLAVTKSFFWDTLNIDWCSVKLYMSNQVIQLPKSVAIPMKHKIKTRRLMSGEGMDIQFMIKQGSTWYNLTNTAQWNRSAGRSCSYAWCKQHDPSAKIRSPKPVEV